MDKSEIKSLCDENPELISDYMLATYSGYDLTDEKDCELYFDETKIKVILMTQNHTHKKQQQQLKEVNNAKQKKEKSLSI